MSCQAFFVVSVSLTDGMVMRTSVEKDGSTWKMPRACFSKKPRVNAPEDICKSAAYLMSQSEFFLHVSGGKLKSQNMCFTNG